MEEKGTKRREWVKNAAIIFLTILLILTFFSRTIQNYSLPEVAAQYVQSGTITAKIRGTGVVESGDPYNVTVEQTRKVASVAVRVGDEVQQGDPLVYLEDEESEELKAAEKELENAQRTYNKALLQADVKPEMIKEANNISAAGYRQQLTAAQEEVRKAQEEVDNWQAQKNGLTAQDGASADLLEAYNNANASMNDAQYASDIAESNYNYIDKQYKYYDNICTAYYKNTQTGDSDNGKTYDVSGGDALPQGMTIEDVEKKVKELYQQRLDAEKEKNEAASNLKDATAIYNQAKANLEASQGNIGGSLAIAQEKLQDKQDSLEKLVGKINTVFGIEEQYDLLVHAQEAYQEELEKSIGAVITAPISGTVTTINAVSGKEVSAQDPVAILQPEGEGYTLSFSVTNDQAKRLSVGDVAELVNAWRYDDVEVMLSSIRPDPAKPGDNRMLTFKVTGEVTAGQSLNVSVGEKSATYDAIVPNSAIREDNNGKFVLVVESRPSPLGNRYVATRMNVEVLASDDTQSAVSGLYGYEFVITTSTAPVEAGQLVRLPENN